MRSPSLGLLRLSFALVPDSSLMVLPPLLLSLSLSLRCERPWGPLLGLPPLRHSHSDISPVFSLALVPLLSLATAPAPVAARA